MANERMLGVAGGTVAIIGLPAYIGWSDRSIGTFLLYALLAGTALAVADHLAASDYRGESAKALAQHALYRIISVAVVGGFVYAIAILAVRPAPCPGHQNISQWDGSDHPSLRRRGR